MGGGKRKSDKKTPRDGKERTRRKEVAKGSIECPEEDRGRHCFSLHPSSSSCSFHLSIFLLTWISTEPGAACMTWTVYQAICAISDQIAGLCDCVCLPTCAWLLCNCSGPLEPLSIYTVCFSVCVCVCVCLCVCVRVWLYLCTLCAQILNILHNNIEACVCNCMSVCTCVCGPLAPSTGH